jgi:hypothetical protein
MCTLADTGITFMGTCFQKTVAHRYTNTLRKHVCNAYKYEQRNVHIERSIFKLQGLVCYITCMFIRRKLRLGKIVVKHVVLATKWISYLHPRMYSHRLTWGCCCIRCARWWKLSRIIAPLCVITVTDSCPTALCKVRWSWPVHFDFEVLCSSHMTDSSRCRRIEVLGRVIVDSVRFGRKCPLVCWRTEAEI